MVRDHIDNVLMTLYASGYRNLPKQVVAETILHLQNCEICSERLRKNLKSKIESEAINARDVQRRNDLDGTMENFIGHDAKEFLKVYFTPREDHRKKEIDIDQLFKSLVKITNVKDICYCMSVMFKESELVAKKLWQCLWPEVLTERLNAAPGIEDVIPSIVYLYHSNKDAGNQLLSLLDPGRLECLFKHADINNIFKCVVNILSSDEKEIEVLLDTFHKKLKCNKTEGNSSPTGFGFIETNDPCEFPKPMMGQMNEIDESENGHLRHN